MASRVDPQINSIELKIPIIKSINSFLSQRNVYVKINTNVSASFCPTTGVLQGSVIAPILFFICVNRLPKMKAQVSEFADDFGLYYRSRSTPLIHWSIIINWCDHLKIKINPNKTQCMIFKNPSKKKSELNLNIKGVTVGKTQSLKFPGVTLTPHLRWNDHCNSLIRRANSGLFQLWRQQSKHQRRESFIGIQILDPATFLYSNACWIDQSVGELIHKKRQCPLNNCKSTLNHLQY